MIAKSVAMFHNLFIPPSGKSVSDVTIDDVIELMHKNTLLVLVGQLGKELRVVKHLKLSSLTVEFDTCCRNSRRCGLVDATDGREERLVAEQSESVFVQVKSQTLETSLVRW